MTDLGGEERKRVKTVGYDISRVETVIKCDGKSRHTVWRLFFYKTLSRAGNGITNARKMIFFLLFFVLL